MSEQVNVRVIVYRAQQTTADGDHEKVFRTVDFHVPGLPELLRQHVFVGIEVLTEAR